jgi:alanyl-tRNA synthetase
MGERSIVNDPDLVFVALVRKEHGIRVIVFAGENARKRMNAGTIARLLSIQLGGSGGGTDGFGQGGGKFREKTTETLNSVEQTLSKQVA